MYSHNIAVYATNTSRHVTLTYYYYCCCCYFDAVTATLTSHATETRPTASGTKPMSALPHQTHTKFTYPSRLVAITINVQARWLLYVPPA